VDYEDVTRVRLRFPEGDPIEFRLEEVVAFGPTIEGFRAWLGAVFASPEGRWLITFDDDAVLGFRREDLTRVRVTPTGVELTLGTGPEERSLTVVESGVRSYGPEPQSLRSWLGRLAHGTGEAWVRLADGRQLRFAIGDGPHVSFLEPADGGPERPGVPLQWS
jgi:hypothetical protein